MWLRRQRQRNQTPDRIWLPLKQGPTKGIKRQPRFNSTGKIRALTGEYSYTSECNRRWEQEEHSQNSETRKVQQAKFQQQN